MSWKQTRARGRGYHHGNLREALIQAARELIKEKGPAGFTFADAARSAGVIAGSALSPFPRPRGAAGRRGARGLRPLRGDAVDRLGQRQARRADAFNNVGRAYLAFARAEPAYYAAMFESGLPPDLNADLRAAGDRAFGVLRPLPKRWWPCCRPASGRPP